MPQVSLTELVAAAQAGELVSFPTDTVPALAARPDAGDRIYAAKQRPADKPLILMGASLGDLRPYIAGGAAEWAEWVAIADRHWPGALTLVLPADDCLPPAINPQNTGTVGIRVPAHPLALHLLAHTGPLATTSANRSGEPPLETMAAIEASFPQALTLTPSATADIYRMLDQPMPAADQPQGSGQPSTVAQWQNHGWKILRPGPITLSTAEHP
ncbi:MAG: Sua5/YciO/YrdC/YwlC family protein [Leptolyngbya sp. DLM2.Bin27]|nr:MAG: Sua5/YciO/YrdC/YwlC family protein [Leptolyngbya sp. DLM2.Bin27]